MVTELEGIHSTKKSSLGRKKSSTIIIQPNPTTFINIVWNLDQESVAMDSFSLIPLPLVRPPSVQGIPQDRKKHPGEFKTQNWTKSFL